MFKILKRFLLFFIALFCIMSSATQVIAQTYSTPVNIAASVTNDGSWNTPNQGCSIDPKIGGRSRKKCDAYICSADGHTIIHINTLEKDFISGTSQTSSGSFVNNHNWSDQTDGQIQCETINGQPATCQTTSHTISNQGEYNNGARCAPPGIAPSDVIPGIASSGSTGAPAVPNQGCPNVTDPAPIYYLINGYNVYDCPNLWDDRSLTTGRRSNGTLPPLRIDGLARSVTITFTGKGLDDGKTYYVCGRFNPDDCTNDARLKSFTAHTGSSGQPEIAIVVCAAGAETLKGHSATGNDDLNTDNKGCDKTRDWFHEGHTYKLHLFQDKNGQALLSSAQIYVLHSFPLVKLAAVGSSKISFSNPLELFLWGRRPGGDNQNNYDIKLQGLDNSTDIERCGQSPLRSGDIIPPASGGETVGINTQWVNLDHPDQPQANDIFTGTGWGGTTSGPDQSAAVTQLGQGDNFLQGIGTGARNEHYYLEINERINEGTVAGKRLHTGSCTGGYTYLAIYFHLDPNAQYGAVIDNVQYDPTYNNNADQEVGNKYSAAPEPPCAKIALNGGCDSVNSAIGPIETTPEGFINTMFKFVLMLAGFGGIIILIYSGYLLMRSQGDKEKVAAARETITSAILGLLFIVLSIVILEIIGVDILRLPGLTR